MIVSILLASLILVGFSLGDDPTTSASNDVTTTVAPTYTLFYPAGAPLFGFNETVGFTWEATSYDTAFYVCHTAVSMGDEALTRYWIASSSHELSLTTVIRDATICSVESLGQSLSQNNFTAWPATCFFGMRGHGTASAYGDRDFFITTSSVTSSTLAPVATTVFVTPSSTAPPGPTMQPTTTAPQPPLIQTIPAALPGPEGKPAFSGGAIAGIAIGSISGFLVLVALIAWRKIVRRRTSSSEALLSGCAPIKESFWKKPKANEATTSSIERGEAVVHEMSAPDPVTVFELESPRHDGLYEMPEK